jgi:hypothetical protein
MSGQFRSEDTFRLHPINRRHFLKAAGSAAVLPAPPAFARQSSIGSANNRINIGVIGMGWQGPNDTWAFLALDDCQAELFRACGGVSFVPPVHSGGFFKNHASQPWHQ